MEKLEDRRALRAYQQFRAGIYRHVQSRGMRLKVSHPSSPICRWCATRSLLETPIKDYRAPPLPGEKTREVCACWVVMAQ